MEIQKLNTKELLDKHPKTTKLIKEWLTNKMLESFKDKTVPENFKEDMEKLGIDDKNLIPIIDGNPYILTEIFDKYELYVSIGFDKDRFVANLLEAETTSIERKKCERLIIECAFDYLENKL